NRLAIIDNKIDLLRRNDDVYYDDDTERSLIGITFSDDHAYAGLRIRSKNKPKKYDLRASSDLVFAVGINNVVAGGETIGDSFSVLGSGFVELGWSWRTRVFKISNALRLKYGFSFQWNKLSPKGDQYFVQNGNVTTLETFPS